MDELEISGKKYISSKRASELSGYAKDYIGQLARGGKVDATRVGRAWYVSLESLQDHEGSEITASAAVDGSAGLSGETKETITPNSVSQGPLPAIAPAKHISLAHLRLGTFDVPKTWESVKYYTDESPLLPTLQERNAEAELSEMTNKINIIQRPPVNHPLESTITDKTASKPIDGMISRPRGFGVTYPGSATTETIQGQGVSVEAKSPEKPTKQGQKRRIKINFSRVGAVIFTPVVATGLLFAIGLTVGGRWSITATESNFALAYGGPESTGGMLLGGILSGIHSGFSALSNFFILLFGSFSSFLSAGIHFILNLLNLG